MSRLSYILFLLLLVKIPLQAEEKITKEDSKAILSYLASDELEGRGTGKEGNWKAARFIAERFKEYGLRPLYVPVYIQPVPLPPPIDGHGYFQHFNYHYSVRAGWFRRRRVTIDTTNVVGVLQGESDRCILFGAHFDHLGIRGGRIYNGADDNASGTTALLELAEAFAKSGKKPKYTLVFAAFSAEEVGLLGSRYYVNYPAVPLKNHNLMINMDMVGRLRNGNVRGIVGRAMGRNQRDRLNPVLNLQSGNLSRRTKDLVHKVAEGYPFSFNLTMAGWRSDHAEFNSQGIPVLFFHTGGHPQYHEPTDDEHLINYDGLVELTKYIFELANEL